MAAAEVKHTIDQGSTFEWIFALKNPVMKLNATTTLGDATVSLAWTGSLEVGMSVTGLGIPNGTTILSITDLNTIELSQNATASGEVELSFTLGGYVDITSLNFRGQLRDTIASPDVGASFAFVKDTVNRTVMMSLTSTQTALLTASDYNYDVEMFSSGDTFVTKVFKGVITILPEVTR